MTRQQWDANMQRFMHRSDLSADLQTVFDYAVKLVHERWNNPNARNTPIFADDDALLDYASRAMHHAGLIYLQELAQDDQGLQREMSMFDSAMSDVQMRWSLDNTSVDMLATERRIV